ncbi:MAG: flagellar basal body L-ring protein FlgH [Paracoccus sp. (in: a-proteobacteria)]|uniref:flagellar basal body L-ring protein FlgH n=1 Tax=Paracoccus sp. TaxID=267 RepID=UPI0026E0A514|nr:flagellar basal body L-ring protein FlgH [Paracoccus sp. (in: a-proteobacteria)]MDO5621236.1 flagellar basal body L-ring protein FlgH [Paracoccus sp. (in: a-proteobacteria)]
MKKLFLILGTLAALSACARVSNIGQPPALTSERDTPEFEAMTNPELDFSMAAQPQSQGASLWQGQQRSIIGDRRAMARGDILTVAIEINDRAEMQNSSGRSRSASDRVSIQQMAGIPQRLANSFPEGAGLDNLAEANSASTFKGSGNISRRDKLTLRVAATVIDRLPNGTLHIQGTQEVRVNNELRDLTVSGFVRPMDIDRNNEIRYDRIAGARISYGGRGQITDVQQPRYGQQLADIILPY